MKIWPDTYSFCNPPDSGYFISVWRDLESTQMKSAEAHSVILRLTVVYVVVMRVRGNRTMMSAHSARLAADLAHTGNAKSAYR